MCGFVQVLSVFAIAGLLCHVLEIRDYYVRWILNCTSEPMPYFPVYQLYSHTVGTLLKPPFNFSELPYRYVP